MAKEGCIHGRTINKPFLVRLHRNTSCPFVRLTSTTLETKSNQVIRFALIRPHIKDMFSGIDLRTFATVSSLRFTILNKVG
jgi:hypothetical protein